MLIRQPLTPFEAYILSFVDGHRLGLILLNQRRDYARAKDLFRRAVTLEPDNSIYLMNLYSVLNLEAEQTNGGKKRMKRR